MKRYTMQAGTTFGESDNGPWWLRSEAAAEMVPVLQDAEDAIDNAHTLTASKALPLLRRLAALIAALEAP